MLLKAYLEVLFMIIGQHERRICYVDCLAGPWKESGENLTGTSITLSLEVMERCHNSLHQQLNKTVEFRALFVEKNKRAYKKLNAFLQNNDWDGVEAASKHGEFHELRDKILDWCGNRDFTFFFIDPKGWKNVIEIPTLTPLLQRPNSEYLINFMYDFILRTHTQKDFQKNMQSIFGEVPDTSGMTPKEREDHLLKLYRDRLKAIHGAGPRKIRSASVTILDPHKDRTKYHLVYLTRHPLGIVKFMEASETLDIVQKKVRAKTKQEKRIEATGQQELWSADVETENDNTIDIEIVKAYWLDKLTTAPKRFGYEKLADMLEETNWFTNDFQLAFKELEDDGEVKNLDSTGRRTKHFIHFDKNERLKRT